MTHQSDRTVVFGDLAGKTAVVTGSSSGIGRAIACELAAAGADVLVHARTNRAGAEATAQCIQDLGRQTSTSVIDLATCRGQDDFCEHAWSWHNGVDVWINNAGADVLTGEAAHWPFEQKLECLWRMDVLGTIRISRTIGRKMCERFESSGPSQTGVIVNVGWDQVDLGMAGDSGEMFAATKGAVMSFTRSLAKTLAPAVRVNCVAPGWIRTSWGEHASAYWQQRASAESLMGRWGTPADVAQAVRYLVSPSASFITGQVLAVNGGWKSA